MTECTQESSSFAPHFSRRVEAGVLLRGMRGLRRGKRVDFQRLPESKLYVLTRFPYSVR